MEGLVSIMMPVFNGEESVRFALSSVLAQTYPDWECIVVDDGSTDRTPELLGSIDDPRVRTITFPHNMGRGVARQAALEAARGEYLAFLDVDDWLYSGKLERQLSLLDAFPTAAAVSGKYAAVNNRSRLMGMDWGLADQTDGAELRRFDRLCRPPLNYAPTMMRMEVARQYCYDARLRRAQDMDFMLKALRGRDFVIDDDARFAYSGWRMTRRRSLRAARYERVIYRSYLRSEPFAAAMLIMKSGIKSAAVSLPPSLAGRLRARTHRLIPPTDDERRAFMHELAIIRDIEEQGEGVGEQWSLASGYSLLSSS